MTALPKVDWYFDVISPYAYLQWTQLHPVSQRAEITPIPVLFAGFLDAWGTKGPAEMPPKKLFVFRHVRWMAGQLGVPYNTPPQHPFNPLKALRLAIALKADPQAIHKLFTAVWVDGHLPDNPEGWAAMAAAQGLSVDEADALTADPAVKRTLLDNGQRALDAGLWGVPSFVIDGDIFWGLDATNMVLDRLTDPALLTGAQDDRIRALSASAERPR
ncbi:MAG: 2-hydroxychromene-2-carboxylate isomerase [Rhodobacterales bacterium]|nr:2-hydroxychromene-2-carboxylate isomerase [Rhodobacterales bacterium]